MRKETIVSILKSAHESDKSLIGIVRDFCFWRKQKCLQWNEYYNFEFDKQSEEFKANFLGITEQGVYLELLNPFKYYILARNKYLAHLLLESAGITVPELYCFYSPENGDRAEHNVSHDLNFTLQVLKNKGVRSCVVKATEGSHGDSVFAVNNIVYTDSDAILETSDGKELRLAAFLQQTPLLFEEKIVQSGQLSELNASSINTVRFMTVLMPSGEAKVVATFIKIGREGAFVDNAGSGGNVDAGVNPKTGELYGAITYNGFRNTAAIDCHPDSGARLNGVVINNWDLICKQVCRFQQRLPFLKAIGWDIAITENGPVVIEINDFWDRTGQLFIQKGWRNEIRECYLAWLEHNQKTGINYAMGRTCPASVNLIKKFSSKE